MENTVKAEEVKLRKILEIEKELNRIQDADVLLERILTEARSIVSADAGSIYICEGDLLKIRYAQNDTKQKTLMPGQKLPFTFFSFQINDRSIAGYSVIINDVVNVPDAYAISPDMPYTFNTNPDIVSGYRTKSILAVPLQTADGKMLGVLQIINAVDSDGSIIAFNADAELYIRHFAVTATQALERAYLTRAMIMRMIQMAEFRDPKETGRHVNRVANYAVEMYDRWAFVHKISYAETQSYRDTLMISSMLHDVGKVGISDIILKKPGGLNDDEYKIIQSHTYIGSLLFQRIESHIDSMARDVALRHHERWDGKGYPGKIDLKTGEPLEIDSKTGKAVGLAGEEIPLAARIVSLVDVFDALSSKRVYKKSWTEDEVVHEIQAQSGRQFDPELVLIFMEVLPRLREIRLMWPDIEDETTRAS